MNQEDLKELEKRVDRKIDKLETLLQNLTSLFERVEKLEENQKELIINGSITKKQPVIYLDKQGNIQELKEDKQ